MTTQRYGIEVLHWAGMKDEFLPYLQDSLLIIPNLLILKISIMKMLYILLP